MADREVTCQTCRKSVSGLASVCPYCGRPPGRRENFWTRGQTTGWGSARGVTFTVLGILLILFLFARFCAPK